MHSRALAVAQHMLDRLLNVYGDPQVGDINEFLREYTEQLVEFNAEELTEGRRIVLGTHKFRRWPYPSECRGACFKARDRIKRREAAKKTPSTPTDKRVIVFLKKDVDTLQWRSWMDRLAGYGGEELKDRCEAVGIIATHSNFPREFDGLEGFIGHGPFVFDRDHDAHNTGWVTVHDENGRQIR